MNITDTYVLEVVELRRPTDGRDISNAVSKAISSSLKSLNFGGLGLRIEDIRAFAPLTSLTSLTCLWFNSNFIDSEDFQALVEMLPSKSLMFLDISENSIDFHGAHSTS